MAKAPKIEQFNSGDGRDMPAGYHPAPSRRGRNMSLSGIPKDRWNAIFGKPAAKGEHHERQSKTA
jgi:hypothetical protein